MWLREVRLRSKIVFWAFYACICVTSWLFKNKKNQRNFSHFWPQKFDFFETKIFLFDRQNDENEFTDSFFCLSSILLMSFEYVWTKKWVVVIILGEKYGCKMKIKNFAFFLLAIFYPYLQNHTKLTKKFECGFVLYFSFI